MNFTEYKKYGQKQYDELSRVVSQILKLKILENNNYKLQQIQNRAKSLESLHQRLQEKNLLESNEIELHRKDLGGCRIIFYTNGDVNRFTQSHVLTDLFDIDWNRSRFHQPTPDEQSSEKLFQSYNFVVKLKEERTNLLEYSPLTGLYCEIQVQTTLNHAWAEMAHDIIYKNLDRNGFGTREMESIKGRFYEVMKNYLLPAGHLFQRIAIDAQRLTEGKTLFDEGIIDRALNVTDNNERYHLISRLKDDILPYYDDIKTIYPEIRDKLAKIWLATEKTKVQPNGTPFGNYKGYEADIVTAEIASIFEKYQYLDVKATYQTVRDLYCQTQSEKSRDQLVKLAESLSSNVLQVWEKCGPHIQVILAKVLYEEKAITSFAPIALTIAKQILNTEIRGTTSSSDTLTIHKGTVPHSDSLTKARRTILVVIADYAETVQKENEKLLPAISVLLGSGRWPIQTKISDEMAETVCSDLSYAIKRISELIQYTGNEVRQKIEVQLYELWRSKASILKQYDEKSNIAKSYSKLIKNINSLKNSLNSNEDFVAFKTIVMYNSILHENWKQIEVDYQRDEQIRWHKLKKLASSINENNWSVWRARIAEAANVQSNDPATFTVLTEFLSLVGEQQPTLLFDLLQDLSGLPDWIIPNVTNSLLKSSLSEDVTNFLFEWVAANKFLTEIAATIKLSSNANHKLITSVLTKAIEEKKLLACEFLLLAAIRHYPEEPTFWRESVFFECLPLVIEFNSFNWVSECWHIQETGSLFDELTKDQAKKVLDAMLRINIINHQTERVLKPILISFPQLIVNWISKRIIISSTIDITNFNAIPDKFIFLKNFLQPHSKIIISMLKCLHSTDNITIQRNASHLLSRIYTEFENPLQETLREILKTATTNDLNFITTNLQGYKGSSRLFPLYRNILASNKCNTDITQQISKLVNETGIMNGEYGVAETYNRKIELLTPWRQDQNSNVAIFAKDTIQSLKLKVARENHLAEERIAQRKLEYGETLTNTKPDVRL